MDSVRLLSPCLQNDNTNWDISFSHSYQYPQINQISTQTLDDMDLTEKAWNEQNFKKA